MKYSRVFIGIIYTFTDRCVFSAEKYNFIPCLQPIRCNYLTFFRPYIFGCALLSNYYNCLSTKSAHQPYYYAYRHYLSSRLSDFVPSFLLLRVKGDRTVKQGKIDRINFNWTSSVPGIKWLKTSSSSICRKEREFGSSPMSFESNMKRNIFSASLSLYTHTRTYVFAQFQLYELIPVNLFFRSDESYRIFHLCNTLRG